MGEERTIDYRKSLIKRGFWGHFGIGHISKNDFVKHGNKFTEIFESICGQATQRIELYAKTPYFTSFLLSDEELQLQNELNEQGMTVLGELSELPDDFSAIPYIRMLLHPKGETDAPRCAFAVVDFSQRLPSHIIFYAQPEEVATAMEAHLFHANKPPKGFILGDGYEENAGYYVPASIVSTSIMPEMLLAINKKERVPRGLTGLF